MVKKNTFLLSHSHVLREKPLEAICLIKLCCCVNWITVTFLLLQGIRYAAPPLKSNRWQPSTVYSPSGSECPAKVDARTFGSKCAQLGPNEGVIGSEDCLFVNVWTPALDTGDDNNATWNDTVLIWLDIRTWHINCATCVNTTCESVCVSDTTRPFHQLGELVLSDNMGYCR